MGTGRHTVGPRPRRHHVAGLAAVLLCLASPPRAEALERICDVAYENCRVPLVDLIRRETVGLDVALCGT